MYTQGGGPLVPPYKKMYFHLFNAVTDALRMMETQDYSRAQIALMLAQQQTEELYIESGEDTAEE